MALIDIYTLARQLRVHPMTIRRWVRYLKLKTQAYTGKARSGKVRRQACLDLKAAEHLKESYREFKSRKRVS